MATLADRYRTRVNLDPTVGDDEVIEYQGRRQRVGDIRRQYDKYIERAQSATLFWDDIIQYTSLGFCDLIFTEFGISGTIPVDEFFARDTEVYGHVWVANWVRDHHKIPVSQTFRLLADNYGEVLLRAPLSQAGAGLLRMREILSHLTVVFLYEFDARSIVRGIARLGQSLHNATIEYNFRGGASEEEYYNSLPKANRQLFDDVVVCRDAGFFTENLTRTGKQELFVVAPGFNNGLTPVAEAIIMDNGNVGPNMASYYFFREGLAGGTP
jgi:hypothetical protein